MVMREMNDTARFREGDPDELVLAAFACPLCLHSDTVSWEASLDGYDPSAQCSCGRCEEEWRVYLTPQQTLRVGLLHAHADRP
jgi:transcription elongation factor Elf1